MNNKRNALHVRLTDHSTPDVQVNVVCSLFQVTVNWFQLQQAQVVSLPVNHQSLCENAKLYEPGQRYIDFVRSLPTDGPRLESHSFDSAATQNTG